MKKSILHRLLTPGLDKIQEVKQKSFIAFLLSQFIFTLYSAGMIFYYPQNKGVYIPSILYTLTVPIIGLFFIKKHFNKIVRIYAFINTLTAIGFLFYVKGNNASHILIALVFLSICVYTSILINYYWGWIIGTLTISLFIVDHYFEQAFPDFGTAISSTSAFHFLLAVFCYFFVIVVLIVIYASLLDKSINGYKKELQLRLKTEKELQLANSALNDMNDELRESMSLFGEINDKLATYAFKNAHQVRAPLCRLRGLINLLDKAKDKQEKKYIIEQITISADELHMIINEMNELLQEEVYLGRSIKNV